MLVLRSTLSWVQGTAVLFGSSSRLLSRDVGRLNRFSRDSLRSRLHRQELKEIVKTETQQPKHQDGFIGKDSIPVRPMTDILKALGFTVGVGFTAFTVASVSDYERLKKVHKEFLSATSFLFNRPPIAKPEHRSPSHGELCALGLLVVNAAVTLLWRVRPLQPMMWRYFSNSFASKSLCSPMFLSVFSHSSVIHLALNMYVLYTFAHVSIDKFFGLDQFLAFYATAGVFSSLASLLHKATYRLPIRALGASGAILALLTYTCCKIPDARLKIVFIPWFEFSAEAAVIGIVMFDLVGLLFRFKLFDHAAHLGGSFFGIAYALWGEELLWKRYRHSVTQWWKNLSE